MVEVQKLRAFYDFCGPPATLCADRARRSALAVAPCEFVLVSANPLRRLCVSKRSPCGAVQFSCSGTAFGSCLVVCAPAFAIPRSRVRFPPGPRQLRSVLSHFLCTNVVRGACSCSSGWKIATFKYRRSMRSVLPQLRLENRNF